MGGMVALSAPPLGSVSWRTIALVEQALVWKRATIRSNFSCEVVVKVDLTSLCFDAARHLAARSNH